MTTSPPTPVPTAAELRQLLRELGVGTFAVIRGCAAPQQPRQVEFTIRRESWETPDRFLARAWGTLRAGDMYALRVEDNEPRLLRVTRHPLP